MTLPPLRDWQSVALEAWHSAGRRGCMEVATGGGMPVKLSVRNFFPASEGPTFGGYDPMSGTWKIISLDGSQERTIDLPPFVVLGESADASWTTSRPEGDLRPFQAVSASMWLRVSSYGPRGLFAWVLADPSQLTLFPLDSRNSFPIVTDTFAQFGASLAPNGRTLLYTHVVKDGADLVLLDNFK